MPSLIDVGTLEDSAANVTATTVLSPTLPATRTNGDWLWCMTQAASASATVAVSAGWTTIWNVATATARLAGFARKVTGSESAPTVTWTGLTAGTSGTAVQAFIVNWGTGWLEVSSALVVDAVSAATVITATAATQAGGAAFYTSAADTWLIAHGVRGSEPMTAVVDAGGAPVAWALLSGNGTTSGAGQRQFISYGVGPSGVGGLVTEHTWALSGSASVDSAGLMIAIALAPAAGEAGPLAYTRGRAPG